jgi:ferredoxin/flavodoxin---NADP+ reductase
MPSLTERFLRARILERQDLTAGLWKIRLDPGGEFSFAAGQFAMLGVETPRGRIARAYSICSSPYEKQLEFFLELVPGGELTPLLHGLNVGDELALRRPPRGRFTLDLKSGKGKHLLLSTVTGIAPYISYVRTLLEDWRNARFPGPLELLVLQGASRSREFGYRAELERARREVPWLKFVPTVSRPSEDPKWIGERGRVEDVLRKYADAWDATPQNTVCYLCGNPDMIANCKGILLRRGFAPASVRVEEYWAQDDARPGLPVAGPPQRDSAGAPAPRAADDQSESSR